MTWFIDRRTFLKTAGTLAATAAFTPAEWLKGSFSARLFAQETLGFGTHGANQIALFGVASKGSVEQWDGYLTPKGILLRWFARPELGFPDYGYDLYRSKPPKKDPLPLDNKYVKIIDGKQTWISGDVSVDSPTPLVFERAGPDFSILSIDTGRSIGLRFAKPAWHVRVSALNGSAGHLKAYSNSILRLEHRFSTAGLDAEWYTRGIDRIELVGPVRVGLIEYRFTEPNQQWQHIKHLCLPVTHPNYLCRPEATNPDVAEAKDRIPVPELWSAKYKNVFGDMYETLKKLAGRESLPPLPSKPEEQPDGPTLTLDPLAAISVSMLDPHVARILGLAWDDPLEPRGLDGEIYSYKIVGRWWRQPIKEVTRNLAAENLEAAHKITFEQTGGVITVNEIAPDERTLDVELGPSDLIRFTFNNTIDAVRLDMPRRTPVSWYVRGEDWNNTGSGQVPYSIWTRFQTATQIQFSSGMRVLEFVGPAKFSIRSLGWTTVSWTTRTGILPGIRAQEPGPPPGPEWISATVRQPVGTAEPIEAALDWDIKLSETDLYSPESTIFYQLAAAQTSIYPATPMPPVTAFDRQYLLFEGNWGLVPPPLAASWPPRELEYDRGTNNAGLPEGWRCWWARGVDMFGRVSAPSPPTHKKIEDTALPPPPILLLGEYAQADLAALKGINAAQSIFAQDWLTTGSNTNAFIVSWAWTPDLHEQCPDVDGFRLFTRRVTAVTSAVSTDPASSYESVPWGSPIASLGPVPTRFKGKVVGVSDGIIGPFSVSVVSEIALRQWECTTTLTLQIGGGALIGATLVGASTTWTITGHGEGTNITLRISGTTVPIISKGYSIAKGASDVVEVTTDIRVPADPSPFQRRLGGVLMLDTVRLPVLHANNGRFICRTAKPETNSTQLPSVGTTASWYPAYVYTIADSGVGPRPSLVSPIAKGQITVRSVRRWLSRPLGSPSAPPISIQAIDVTEPAPPLTPMASGEYCAEVATRPDWYGISRFTLTWTPDPTLTYMVYRALRDAVIRLDLAAHTIPPATTSETRHARAHSIDQALWIPEVWNDVAKRQVVQSDLAALDAALSLAVPLGDLDPTRRTRIAAAYAALHADTQRIIAYQPYARTAFSARFGKPINASQVPYVDTIDGRSQARWFYRIASRTPAGIESEWTPPTPPICCPDVVPPKAPQVISALAGIGKVRLRWIASPKSDVKLYRIYRTQEERKAVDIRLMEEGEAVGASSQTTTPDGLELPSPVIESDGITVRPGWLQFDSAVPNAGKWCFRLIAEDTAGNRSLASNVLEGSSLIPVLVPPTWVLAVRSAAASPNHVALTWSHQDNQRLSCLLERRYTGSSVWRSITGWMPRGAYSANDTPAMLSAGLEYRIKARDTYGQVAQSPIISVAPSP